MLACYPPLAYLVVAFVFFFSSRRRHTRYWRDWSSDVCSSDLACRPRQVAIQKTIAERNLRFFDAEADKLDGWADDLKLGLRSEERRVGKECRSRWVPCNQKKNNMRA